jgi:hypothetical protein
MSLKHSSEFPHTLPPLMSSHCICCRVLLLNGEKDDGYPVLVIDEANMIMDWSNSHSKDLKSFMQASPSSVALNRLWH